MNKNEHKLAPVGVSSSGTVPADTWLQAAFNLADQSDQRSGSRKDGGSMTYFEQTLSGFVLPRLARWDAAEAARELAMLALNDGPLWLHFDPFCNANQVAALGALLEAASARRIGIVPVMGAFVPEERRAALAIRTADGEPGAAICYHQPETLALAAVRAGGFVEAFGAMACLHLFTGHAALHFAPELAPSGEAPCYCAYCVAGFAAHLEAHGFEPVTTAPRNEQEGYLWWQWLDFQADAVHRFALRLMQTTRSSVPFWMAR